MNNNNSSYLILFFYLDKIALLSIAIKSNSHKSLIILRTKKVFKIIFIIFVNTFNKRSHAPHAPAFIRLNAIKTYSENCILNNGFLINFFGFRVDP